MDIAEVLDKFDKKHHPRGETLPTGTRVYRVKIVQAFLKSGTPLNRLEYLRDIFQEAGVTFTYCQTCESLSLSSRRGVQIYCQRTTGEGCINYF